MLNDYTMSYHLQYERTERLTKIASTIGFGEVIKESVFRNANILVTSTGVICVVNKSKKIIITVYTGTINEMKAIYNGRMPQYLYNQVLRNQKIKWD